MKNKKLIGSMASWICLIFLMTLINSCQRAKKPQEYGVHVVWKYGGATSSYPWIEVWASNSEIRVESPMIFGGIEDPQLNYKDMDGDGVLDIVFGNKSKKQILAYKPQSHTFVVLRNDMKGREY